ncbi:hypothetical protein [Nocardia nova]|uniref:hypothetical protein n=1 Tax=Nocardia nova TaxID=37330 RepID=UPI0018951A9A|nr:hypothetical protein [Nocardia nova]MBF6145724.1 hypothetical protein [Nocardia nova]
MATRTPWSDVHPGTGDLESSGSLPTPPGGRRPSWGYLCSAALSAATLVLLFQPWLSASGPGGAIRSDAFGRLTGTTVSQQDWAGAGLRDTDISGTWAVLTCVAVLATIFAAVAYLRTRASIFSAAAAVAGTSVAVFVLADVLYLDNKESEMRAAVADDSSFSGILRGLFGGAHAAHQLAGAHLDFAAMLAGITAFGAAACVLTNHLRDNPIVRTVARPTTRSVAAAHPSTPTARPQTPTASPSTPTTPHPVPAALQLVSPAATAPQLVPTASPSAPTAPHVAPAALHPASIASQPVPTAPNPMPVAPHPVPAASPLVPVAPQLVPAASHLTSAASQAVQAAPNPAPAGPQPVPTAPNPVPAATHPAPTAPHQAPPAPATPPAPVVEFGDITAERHEPAPSAAELPPFPVRKQPSWRIVIPAGAVSAHAPARGERTFAN